MSPKYLTTLISRQEWLKRRMAERYGPSDKWERERLERERDRIDAENWRRHERAKQCNSESA